MKRALLAVLVVVNLISLAVLVTGLLAIVAPILRGGNVEVTLSIVCLVIGISAPALTAGVLFKTQILSGGNTWKEIVDDLKPLLPWARG